MEPAAEAARAYQEARFVAMDENLWCSRGGTAYALF